MLTRRSRFPWLPVLVVSLSAGLGSLPRSAPGAEAETAAFRDGPRRTAILGGGGGAPFEAAGPPGAVLVGFRTTTLVWAGHEIVRSIQPLFLSEGEVREGPVFGMPNGRVVETLAEGGYAVGGLAVRAGHRVDGFSVRFMRLDGERLDPSDAYDSDWVGGQGGGEPTRLGGEGHGIVGICGRHGADVDALGLLESGKTARKQADRRIRLVFSGRVDGSERIVIGAAKARWENVHWGMSNTTVTLGGVSWTPRESPDLVNEGATRYLAVPVDFSSARLEKTAGRDAVLLEPGPDTVTVRIADNPNGTDHYEFAIVLEPLGRSEVLSIRGTIDGSDEIVLTAEKATWVHHHWGWPRGEVFLNDAVWNPSTTPEILNEGSTRYLSDDVELRTARVVRAVGRDLVGIEVFDDRVVVKLVDTPVGSAVYELLIRFGPEPR